MLTNPQYVIDKEATKTAVILPIKEWENLMNELDKLILKSTAIKYSSSNDYENEIKEMEQFIIEVEKYNLSRYIHTIFYDSKQSFCTFEVSEELESGDTVSDFLIQIALKYISQFSLIDNRTYHGGALFGIDEAEEEYYRKLEEAENKA
jgi:hypothetical protein